MADRNHPRTPLPRRQSADRGRVGGRAATRGSSVKFGALSSAIVKKSKGDSGPDIKGALVERDQTRNQALSNSIAAALNDSVALAKEQNGLLAQIINELRGAVTPAGQTGGGPVIGDIDVDIDRDKRGKGQRGRFGARGRERLQRLREFRAARGATPRPTAAAPRSVGSAMRTVGQTFTRIAPSLGAAAAPALAVAAAGASLGIIGTAAYRAATMSPEEREAIRQRAEGQAAAGRQGLTEGQQSGRGVGQGLRAGYYGDQPADLRLEDILDTLDTPAQNETPEQRTARERMATQLTRGNGRPTPEMIEYVRSRRAASSATQQQTPQYPAGHLEDLIGIVRSSLALRGQPERLDEVVNFIKRMYPRGLPRSNFLIQSKIHDYLRMNPPGSQPQATEAVTVQSDATETRDNFTRVESPPESPTPTQPQATADAPPVQATAAAAVSGSRVSSGFSRILSGIMSPRQPRASQGGDLAAGFAGGADVSGMGLEPVPAQRGGPKTIAEAERMWPPGHVEELSRLVRSRLNMAGQPERFEEVMEFMIGRLPRGLFRSNFGNESILRDYLTANPGRRTEARETLERVGQEMVTGGQETQRMLEQQPQAVQPKSDPQGLLTNLSSGVSPTGDRGAYKDTTESVTKSPITVVSKQKTDPTSNAQSLLDLLSGTEFREIKFEADTFEFDGRVSLSKTEASLVSPTAFISRGQYESEAPTGGGQSSGSSSTGGGNGGQSSPSAPPSRSSFQQGAVASRSSSAASPVASSGATPSISGGFEGAGGGGEGSISQIIQSGPGFNLVQYDDGRIERRTGSRNWRNNNPGNLEFGDFARRYGAIGSDGRFAIFPTYEAGKRAKEALLFEGRGYAGMTIAQAITRYAPPNENDTAMYIRTAAAAAGVSPNTLMGDLNAEQRQALLAAMERVEGFRVGRVDIVQQGTAVAAAQPPAGGAGAGLGAESTGMVAADQAQAMGAGRQVVVQLPNGGAAGAQGSASVQTSSGPTAEVSLNRRLEGQVS